MSEDDIPAFPPGVRLRHDDVRGAWVMLAPERLFMPDEHALAVLALVDGRRSMRTIVDDLASRYAAPRAVIAEDVGAMLDELAGRGVVRS